MPSFPTRRLAATTASVALLLTVLVSAPAQAATSPTGDASAGAAPTTAAASTSTVGVAADLSADMLTVPTAPLLRARTDAAVSPAVGVTTHPVFVSVATVTAATADDAPTPPDEASARAAVAQLHDYWWEESGHTVDVTFGGFETRSLGQASCVPSTVLNTVHTSAFGGRFARYAWAGTNEHLLVLSRETCGTTATAFGTVGGDGGEVFSSYGTGTQLGVPVLLHEFGHNLGFGHAGVGMCRSTTSFDGAATDYRYATSTDSPATCPVLEYGDFLDIMGYSVSSARPHLSTVQRARAGYLTDVTTLSGAGTTRRVVVAPLDGAAKGRAVRVVDPVSGQDYYVEYRTATGRDATSAEFGGRAASCAPVGSGFTRCALTSDATTGSVRVLRPLTLSGSTVSTVALAVGLDAGRDPSRRDPHLDAGETFTSAGGGFTVAVRSMTPSGGAVLDVTLAGAAKQPPTVAAPTAPTTRTTSTLTVDRTRQAYGSATRITATTRVVTADGSAAAGTVTLRDGSTVVGSAKVGSDGRSAVTLPATWAVGAHSLRASFVPGTKAQTGSDSAVVPVTVVKATSTSVVSAGTTLVKKRAATNVTVTVAAPGVPNPTGVVTVTAGGKVLGTARLAATGSGRVSVPVTPFTRAGAYAISASYAGTDSVAADVSKRTVVVVR